MNLPFPGLFQREELCRKEMWYGALFKNRTAKKYETIN